MGNQAQMNDVYILDTSALFSLRNEEPGVERVAGLLRHSEKGGMVGASFMSFMEFFYCIWRVEGHGEALRAYLELKMLPLKRVESSEKILLLAGEIKANYSLSLGDSWVAATAMNENAILVHKDPEFEPLKDQLRLEALPYKSSTKMK